MAAELLSKIRGEIDARLREMGPLLAEYESLLLAASELAAAPAVEENAPVAPRPASRRKGSAPPKRAPRNAPPKLAQRSAPPKRVQRDAPPKRPQRSAPPKRPQRSAAAVAIVAALEHGSHTVSELAIVTAMGGPLITSNLRRLQQAGAVIRAKREGDGKGAYALSPA